ncbi:MAG TPA: hypothetical protein VGM92_05870 [Candidatus Kapabacteria bacterium]|jgi:hypothetical protein
MMKVLSIALLSYALSIVLCSSAYAQLTADELTPDSYVKLQLVDSSEFYVVVLARPVPDRILAETRYGTLEIPLTRIAGAIDYRYNWVQKDDLKRAGIKAMADEQKYEVTRFLTRPKLPDLSTVSTKDHNLFKGHRYIFDDTAHVILATDYGNLYFRYPDLDYVDNWSGQGDRREDFATALYYTAKDPMASQDFLLPNARPFDEGSFFLSDYMLAGLQVNYGPTYWLGVNAGGVEIPFLTPPVTAATAGIKITPYQIDPFNVSVGFQEVYSKVVKMNTIAFPYIAVTYGTWESELSLLGGEAFQDNDSAGFHTHPKNSFLGASGDMRVGENLKVMLELYFIENFGIVPTVFSVRYFENNFTIDVGVVFSLYKAGADQSKTLGDYVFNTSFSIVPIVSGSYHF